MDFDRGGLLWTSTGGRGSTGGVALDFYRRGGGGG